MAFLGKGSYRDLGDLSDISDVSADELARMVEDADDLDSHIFGTKKPAKDAKPSPKNAGPLVVGASPKKTSGTGGIGDILGDTLLPDNTDNKELLARKNEDRGDWLGLKVDIVPRPRTSQTPAKSVTVDTKRPFTSAGSTNQPLTAAGDPPIPGRRVAGPVSVEPTSPLPIPVVAKKSDRSSLIQDLFGPPSWEKKKEEKQQLATFSPEVPKEESNKSELSYIPSVGGGSGGRRTGGSRPRPQISLDEFDLDINPQPSSLISDKINIPDWLGGPKKLDKISVADKEGTKALATSTPVQQPDPPGILKNKNAPEPLDSVPVQQAQMFEQQTSALQPVHLPVNEQQPAAPYSMHPLQFQMQYLQIQESVDGDKEEMVGALASAQATLGAAMARHHSNMHTYMKMLLEEARRMSVYPKRPEGREKNTDTENESSPKKRKRVKKGKIEKFITGEDKVLSEQEENEEKEKKSECSDDFVKSDENKSEKHKEDSLPDLLIEKHVEEAVINLKAKIKDLEVDNFNLKMRVESLKTSHKLEVESFRRTAQHDALLWEARIERLQHFCFEIEREYSNKIDKMKENEEDLLKSHKMRLKALQEERLDEVRRLNDLHKVILEQALSVTVMYPQYRASSGIGGGGFKLPIRISEKPESEKELTEREVALMDKEKQLAVGKAELEAIRENWLEDKTRAEEELKDREASVRDEEKMWKETKQREERELARKEDSARQLIKQAELMREDAINEVSSLAKEKLAISTEKAKIEAVMKSDSGEYLPNTDQLFQVRAQVEAGLAESKKAQASLDSERRRLIESHRRVEEWKRQLEERDRELLERERRAVDEIERAEAVAAEAEAKAESANRRADSAESAAKRREMEANQRAAELDRQISDLAREKMEATREKYEIEAAKARLEVLLPELTPAESLKFIPSRNYVDPKSVIMRLRAEKDLECLAVPKRKYF